MSKRKSMSFYLLCFCMILITVTAVVAVVWQPGFRYGLISISIMDSRVGYNLWGFLMSLLSLMTFIYCFVIVVRSRVRKTSAFIAAFLSGLLLIVLLDNITYGWTSYPPLSALGRRDELTSETYHIMLLSIQGLVAVAMGIVFFRWYKAKTAARISQTTNGDKS